MSWTPGVTLGVRTHTRARVCTQTHESVRRHASAVNASLHLTRVIRDSAVQRSRRGFMAVRCSTDRSSSPLALLRQPRVPRHPSHGHREAIAASLASSLPLIPSGRSLFPLPPPPPLATNSTPISNFRKFVFISHRVIIRFVCHSDQELVKSVGTGDRGVDDSRLTTHLYFHDIFLSLFG